MVNVQKELHLYDANLFKEGHVQAKGLETRCQQVFCHTVNCVLLWPSDNLTCTLISGNSNLLVWWSMVPFCWSYHLFAIFWMGFRMTTVCSRIRSRQFCISSGSNPRPPSLVSELCCSLNLFLLTAKLHDFWFLRLFQTNIYTFWYYWTKLTPLILRPL